LEDESRPGRGRGRRHAGGDPAPKRHPRRTETLQGAIGETNPVADLTGLSAG